MLPNNLYTPAPGDQGARGMFSERGHARQPRDLGDRHRGPMAAAASPAPPQSGGALVAAAGVVGAAPYGGA